jgi:hypothetical protein
LQIISKLLNHLLSWAGVDVDLSKIKINTNAPTPVVDPSIVNESGVGNSPSQK